jgi:hypothetical protein
MKQPGFPHAERAENPLRQYGLETLPRDSFDDLTENHVVGVVVVEDRAGLVDQLPGRVARQQLIGAVGQLVHLGSRGQQPPRSS